MGESHDPGMTQPELAIQTVMRMTLGIADNIAWRLVQLTVTTHVTRRSLTAAAVLCMLLLFAMLSQLTRRAAAAQATRRMAAGA